MLELICPICRKPLRRAQAAFRCENNHSYDIARSGYVNLLPPSPSGKRHGDDKRMVAARTAFLSGGYYDHLMEAVCQLAGEYTPQHAAIVDAGCGEGAYTRRLYDTLCAMGRRPEMIGLDISADAARRAARALPDGCICVASTASMPLSEGSADLIVNIFSPFMPAEFHRVLRAGGYLLRVVPMERHLWELKAAVYDIPYENPPTLLDAEGFSLVQEQQLRKSILLPTHDAVQALFEMTPYYYKTGAEDQKKLDAVNQLTVTTEFLLAVYQKPETYIQTFA